GCLAHHQAECRRERTNLPGRGLQVLSTGKQHPLSSHAGIHDVSGGGASSSFRGCSSAAEAAPRCRPAGPACCPVKFLKRKSLRRLSNLATIAADKLSV